jgi:hypothetical protein
MSVYILSASAGGRSWKSFPRHPNRGERIRDKIATSKERNVDGRLRPIGYDVRDPRIMIDEGEAETVR